MTNKNVLKNKFFIFTLLTLVFLGVSQAQASNDHKNESRKEERLEKNEHTASKTENESCDDDVKNHGEYVSCFAKTHDEEKVSDAARSDVGKKHTDVEDEDEEDDDDNTNPTVTPIISPSVSPVLSPTGTVSGTPTPSETPTTTPSVTPEPESTSPTAVSGLIKALQDLITALTSAFHL